MRLRGNRYRRRLLPDRRQPAMPREAPSSVPKFLTAALVWTVTAGIFVYICSRIPMVRDHEWFVAWAALSALPWLTIWGQRRRAPVSAAKVEDHREHRSQTNRSDSVNRQEGVFDSAAAKRRSPEDLRGASPGRIDLDGDETTVGLGHTATTSPPTFGSNGFHDTRPLNRLTGEDRRPDRQLTYDHAPLTRARGQFVFSAASRTHDGMRPSNQDYALITPIVLGVADGVGGRPDGAAASQAALESVVRSLVADPDASLAEVMAESNNDVRTQVGHRSGTSAATTLDLVYLDELGELTGAHVGDSRVGVLAHNSAKIEWLTADHATGNTLTRSIGPEPTIKPDIWVHSVEPGDLVIVATDGLWDPAHGQTAAEQHIIDNRDQHPDVIADILVRGAVRNGTRDNVTVVVGRISVK